MSHLQKTQNAYEAETSKTQESISLFLSNLMTAYDPRQLRKHFTGASLPDELRFAGARVQNMIQELVTADT